MLFFVEMNCKYALMFLFSTFNLYIAVCLEYVNEGFYYTK